MAGPKVAAAKQFLKKAWDVSRSAALNKTRQELAVEDALDDKPWGPTGQQLTGG